MANVERFDPSELSRRQAAVKAPMKSSRKSKGPKPKAGAVKRKENGPSGSDTPKPVPSPNSDGSGDRKGDTFPFQGKRLL